MDVIQRDGVAPFITADGSEIRELMAHRNAGIRNQTLAEATVPPGGETRGHYHPLAEEIYYILKGAGLMWLEGEERAVGPGEAIAIPPGRRHRIRNTGPEPLVFLCCCAPGYEHSDTVITSPA